LLQFKRPERGQNINIYPELGRTTNCQNPIWKS